MPASGTGADGADGLGGATVLALLLFLVRVGHVVLGRSAGSGSEASITAVFFRLGALIISLGVFSAPESPKDSETSTPSPASRLSAFVAAPWRTAASAESSSDSMASDSTSTGAAGSSKSKVRRTSEGKQNQVKRRSTYQK
ncbi:hypothetical protein ACFX16_031174 [Malus domestica]